MSYRPIDGVDPTGPIDPNPHIDLDPLSGPAAPSGPVDPTQSGSGVSLDSTTRYELNDADSSSEGSGDEEDEDEDDQDEPADAPPPPRPTAALSPPLPPLNRCNESTTTLAKGRAQQKQAIDGGLKLNKIHRVLRFSQKPWLKEYIDFNTEKRKVAKNNFEKDFFKLMNNSMFGRSMMNVRKRQNIKLVTDKDVFQKYISKPTYNNDKNFNENLAAVHYVKDELLLDKPIYTGFSVLELSKTLMYDFHYGYIKNK